MSQKREPPAYLEYAANMLANRAYRLMNASQRGVLYSMRLECWANRSVPADPHELAAILGLDAAEVAAALPFVMRWFSDETGEIRCPELDNYRADREAARNAKVEGGKRGAEVTNRKKRLPKTRAATGKPAMPSGVPSDEGRHLNVNQPNPTQSPRKDVGDCPVSDPWLAAYSATEQVEAGKRVRVVV